MRRREWLNQVAQGLRGLATLSPLAACAGGRGEAPAAPAGGADVRFGAAIMPLPLFDERIPLEGIHTNIIQVNWSWIEQQPGRYVFKRLDRALDVMGRAGLAAVVVKIMAKAPLWSHALDPYGGREEFRGKPPGNEPSIPPFSYDAYSRFVLALVSHLRDRARPAVSSYAFEVEMHAPAYWYGSARDYEGLVAAGAAAVKAADPRATTLDGGMSSGAHGVAIGRQLLRDGDATGALDFVNAYFARRWRAFWSRSGLTFPFQNTTALRAFLDSKLVGDIDAFFEYVFSERIPTDAYHLHFVEGWEMLPRVMEWIHGRDGP